MDMNDRTTYHLSSDEIVALKGQLEQLEQARDKNKSLRIKLNKQHNTWFKYTNGVKRNKGSSKPLTNDEIWWCFDQAQIIMAIDQYKNIIQRGSISVTPEEFSELMLDTTTKGNS